MIGPILRVEGLSKRYRIGSFDDRQKNGLQAISSSLAAPFGYLRQMMRPPTEQETLWALKGVSFQVQSGEVVGIIGRNGAGKSTLLKILSRITDPTSGRAVINGRVGSLLEVGTGFNAELTGRENIYLSGTILGMKRREIQAKFDEIVSFAGVERFLDTPVKRYSSGMNVRLGFAVAAHLDPEVLMVDEVLAVGDVAFQRKCLGKMEKVSREGRTILFVSHNLTAIRSLCQRALLLEAGNIVYDGDASQAIEQYLGRTDDNIPSQTDLRDRPRPPHILGNTDLRITRVRLHSRSAKAIFYTNEPLTVTLEFRVQKPLEGIVWGFTVDMWDGLRILDSRSTSSFRPIPEIGPGDYSITGALATNPLAPGHYSMSVGARGDQGSLDYVPGALEFVVEEAKAYDSIWHEKVGGVVRVNSDWQPPERLTSS